MRTNVVIDDDLMTAALESTGLKTKRAVIEKALRTLIQLKSQEQVRLYRGKLHWEEIWTFCEKGDSQMWIVDSSVWIEYFAGIISPQTDLLDASLGQQAIGVGDIILCEVLQGFHHERDFEIAKDILLRFPVYTVGGAEIAVKSAQNYRLLRRRGITVRKTVDCLIATFVIENHFSLLHNDRDFDPFEIHLGLDIARANSQYVR